MVFKSILRAKNRLFRQGRGWRRGRSLALCLCLGFGLLATACMPVERAQSDRQADMQADAMPPMMMQGQGHGMMPSDMMPDGMMPSGMMSGMMMSGAMMSNAMMATGMMAENLARPYRSTAIPIGQSAAAELLKQRNAEFTPEVIRLTERVYAASGYSVSTISMVIGNDGYFVIDTGIHPDHAARARTDFEKITDKPLVAIIYTHGHGDHTRGAAAFLPEDDRPIDIYAAANYGEEAAWHKHAGVSIIGKRGMRQAGFALPRDKRINNGVAPAVWLKRVPYAANMAARTKPNKNITAEMSMRIAGVQVEFIPGPGETHDQLMLWLPDEKVAFSGDNFYKSWPNLYAIRGTGYRDVKNWYQSLEKLRSKQAEFLVGGHTRPVQGRAQVDDVLGNYSRAIRFVFEKTIEGINKGLTPHELVDYVQLPDDLAEKDYLRPYYGHPDWAIRSIFEGYLGWFDGNPSNLFPLPPRAEAEHMAALAGGHDALYRQAVMAIKSGQAQWAAQLCDHLLALDANDKDVLRMKADALDMLGEALLTATGRNYYFTFAEELRKQAAGSASDN